jgi:hypothetical protein
VADGAERANMAVFTDAEDTTCAGTFADPAATPARDVAQSSCEVEGAVYTEPAIFTD